MQNDINTDITQWCIKQLENADDYFMPLNILCKEYCASSGTSITLMKFEEILLNDDRFTVTPGHRKTDDNSSQDILTQLNLPATSLVGLAGRNPSKEELDNAIKAKAYHMRYALQKAWDARPQNDDEAEERLLFLLEQAENLCEALGVDQPEEK